MVCFRCATPNPEVARFCHHCGAVLIMNADRGDFYAAHPSESVRALALVSTLMPHASAHRHHVYRLGIVFALGAAVVAAGFGVLPVALICAGVALPGMLLTYFHDHEVWADEPMTVLALCVGLAAALGVGVGFLGLAISHNGLVSTFRHNLPSIGQLLLQCLLLPAVVFAALQVPPGLVTARPKFRHALDALTLAALSGVALALAESIVVQHGAFSRLTVYGTQAAPDAFIALTLGFAKPIVYACASAIAVMRIRRGADRYVVGLAAGFGLLAIFDTSVATLTSYGQRGTVLIFLITAAEAAVGLLLVRDEAHTALLGEAAEAAQIAPTGAHGGDCANCGLPLLERSAFCLACGTAVAAMPKQHQRTLPPRPSASA